MESRECKQDCNVALHEQAEAISPVLDLLVTKLERWQTLSMCVKNQLQLLEHARRPQNEEIVVLQQVESSTSAHVSRLSQSVRLQGDFAEWVHLVFAEMRSFTQHRFASMCKGLPSQVSKFTLLANTLRRDIARQIAEMRHTATKTSENVVQVKNELAYLERAFASRDKFSLKLEELHDFQASLELQQQRVAHLEKSRQRLSQLFETCQSNVRTVDEQVSKAMDTDVIKDMEAHSWMSTFFYTKARPDMGLVRLPCSLDVSSFHDGDSSSQLAGVDSLRTYLLSPRAASAISSDDCPTESFWLRAAGHCGDWGDFETHCGPEMDVDEIAAQLATKLGAKGTK